MKIYNDKHDVLQNFMLIDKFKYSQLANSLIIKSQYLILANDITTDYNSNLGHSKSTLE